MLLPFVLPELLVRAIVRVVEPVVVHVRQQRRRAVRLQDRRDVGVGAGGVAAGLVRAVAEVGPVVREE